MRDAQSLLPSLVSRYDISGGGRDGHGLFLVSLTEKRAIFRGALAVMP